MKREKMQAVSTPGMIPAMKSCATDTPVKSEKRMNIPEGGIMQAKVPADAIDPRAKDLS